MTIKVDQYPRRRPFFANRFCRLMTKVCLANQIGPESCFLLMTVAMTEDAKSYRSGVTYWNEQLYPLVGLSNVKALSRVRDKAVEAGWLHYEPGGKGRPGVYWVTIPSEFVGMDDNPADENMAEYLPALLDKNDPQSGQQSGRKVGKEAGEKRERSGQHSSLTPFLEESPTVSGADAPPAAGVKPKPEPKPRKEPSGPHADARRAFCERWKAKYGEDYAFDFKKHGEMIRWMLSQVKDDVPKLIGIMDRFLADADSFFVGQGHLIEKLRQSFNRWLIDPNTAKARPLTMSSNSTPYEPYENFIPKPRATDDH